jgi:hypothetical protein
VGKGIEKNNEPRKGRQKLVDALAWRDVIMGNYLEVQVNLFDRTRRIERPSRQITVSFNEIDSHSASPDELTGTIVGGLTDAEAVTLIPSGGGRSELAELYVADRASHRGQDLRYLLTELQREAPGRFPFKAKRDF